MILFQRSRAAMLCCVVLGWTVGGSGLLAADANIGIETKATPGGFALLAAGRPILTGGHLAGDAVPVFEADGTSIVCKSLGRMTATVDWGQQAFLCRLKRPEGQKVVQLGLGRVESLLADSLFDPVRDAAVTFKGEGVRLIPSDKGYRLTADRLRAIRLAHDVYKQSLGIKWFRPLDKSVFSRAPCGWCTWYYYYHDVTEQGVMENARWLSEHLLPFGATVCQVDDGWQSPGYGGDHRDWLRTSPRFPHGMKWLADQLKGLGLVPGIWLCPFGQSDGELFRKQPGLFVRLPDGKSIGEPAAPSEKPNWNGRYFLDCTGEEGQAYLRRLFKMLCQDWGYDYVKIDGQGGIAATYGRYRQRLTKPMPGDEAYRLGLQTMVDVMGPGRFLLNCAQGRDSAGLCQGMRIGSDVGTSWKGMQSAVTATMRWLFLNNVVWYADPDVVCVRPPLTLDQARMWVTMVGITGQMTLASDKMSELPPERVELLRRICPVADVRPMDLFPYVDMPPVFDLKTATAAGRWDVVALFNWTDTAASQVVLAPADLGLPAGRYVYYDVWSKRLLAAGAEPLAVHLAPSSCRVVAVRPMLQRPQLLGTSRHITQGADDLEKVSWDEQANTSRGTSRVVGNDPYEIRFTLPPGWAPASSALRREAGMAVLVLRSETSATISWEAPFQRAATRPAAPSAPTDAQLKAEGGRATLSWKPSPGAMAYQVLRNGELLGVTGDTTLADVPHRPKTLFRYEVAARDFTGRLSASTTVGQFKTPPARDAWLEEVPYLKHRQDYGHLAVGQSHDGHPLTLGGTVFKHGLGVHANAETVYALGGGYRRFEARCGVDDEKGGLGSCVFQVWADGKKLFDSGVLRGKQPARQISVDLRGREQLRLVVTDAGDGINCDHADWVDAMLLADRGE